MAETKRRPKTSTAAKMRYNKKAYDRLYISVPKQLAQDFKAKCAADGISQAQVIKKAIEEYLK